MQTENLPEHIAVILFLIAVFYFFLRPMVKQMKAAEVKAAKRAHIATHTTQELEQMDDEFFCIYQVYAGAVDKCETKQELLDLKDAVIDLECDYPYRYACEIQLLHDRINARKSSL